MSRLDMAGAYEELAAAFELVGLPQAAEVYRAHARVMVLLDMVETGQLAELINATGDRFAETLRAVMEDDR